MECIICYILYVLESYLVRIFYLSEEKTVPMEIFLGAVAQVKFNSISEVQGVKKIPALCKVAFGVALIRVLIKFDILDW